MIATTHEHDIPTSSHSFASPMQYLWPFVVRSLPPTGDRQNPVRPIDRTIQRLVPRDDRWYPWDEAISAASADEIREIAEHSFVLPEYFTPLFYTDLYDSLPIHVKRRLNHGFYSLVLRSIAADEFGILAANHPLIHGLSFNASQHLQVYLRHETTEENGNLTAFEHVAYSLYPHSASLASGTQTLSRLTIVCPRAWYFLRAIANIGLHIVEDEIYNDSGIPIYF